MAEEPRVFTAAPWGYRILTPWAVRLVSPANALRGFRQVTFFSLLAGGAFLYLFLRAVGHGEVPAAAAVVAFGLSPPVAEVLRTVVTVEPLTMTLTIAFLWAVEAEIGLAWLALLAVLLACSKEVWVLLLPLVFLSRRRRGGRGALVSTLLVGLPALGVTLALRQGWVPHIQPGHAPFDAALVRAGWVQLRQDWGETWPAFVLGGLVPLAVAGALRARAGAFRRRYGWLVLAWIVLALVAWINVPSATPVPLFGRNVIRLMIYAVPVLLAFGLFVLPAANTEPGTTRRPGLAGRRSTLLGWALVAAMLALVVGGLDRYRRVPLHGARDGPLVLALCRESLRVARRLEGGLEVSLDPESRRFEWGVSDPGRLQRMRWFLREGWGERPHYGAGDVVLTDAVGTLLVPCLEPRDLLVTLGVFVEVSAPLSLSLNDVVLVRRRLEPGLSELPVALPAAGLFRGDNRLSLSTEAAAHLRLIGYRLASRPPP
jgi:hypothetical protein